MQAIDVIRLLLPILRWIEIGNDASLALICCSIPATKTHALMIHRTPFIWI
jgi:hypothetical protein